MALNQHLDRLAHCEPGLRRKALACFAKGRKLGAICVRGLATFAEQNALYAQGRTKPGRIVTNARGGQSYHNFGLAFDFCIVRRGRALFDTSDPAWRAFVKIAKAAGFVQGDRGNYDPPHFQPRKVPSLASLRRKYPKGYRHPA